MNPNDGLLSIAGVVLQFLRAYPWFGNWTTIAVGLGVAAIATMTNAHGAGFVDSIPAFISNAKDVFATLSLSHIVAHATGGKVLPTYNQLGGTK